MRRIPSTLKWKVYHRVHPSVLQELMGKRVDYYFGEITPYTKGMTRAFGECYKQDEKRAFQCYQLDAECEKFEALVHASISSSVYGLVDGLPSRGLHIDRLE